MENSYLPLPLFVRRVALKFLAANSLIQLISILSVFIPLRVLLSFKNGIVTQGDGAVEAGLSLGQFWVGEVGFKQLVNPREPFGEFLSIRTSELLYPFLISPQKLVGWDIHTYLLVLHSALGSTLVIAAYFTASRLQGKSSGVLVALLMCSLTALYWIARFGIIDNLFYAMLPLFALSVINWYRDKTGMNLTLMILGIGAFALTRPESVLVILSVALILAGDFLRRFFSPKAMAGVLFLIVAAGAIATMFLVSLSPSLRKSVLSRSHVAWGLATSANTLFNRGTIEYEGLRFRYDQIRQAENLNNEGLAYRMSTDAIVVIKAHPLRYLLKIPLRGLALLFPWTYQPWSLPHIVYEAVYTILLMAGLVLLIRRGNLETPLLVLLVIPLSIWLFLSAYGIDNDLKHRNGILVGLNLIAPLGFFVTPRSRRQVGFPITETVARG